MVKRHPRRTCRTHLTMPTAHACAAFSHRLIERKWVTAAEPRIMRGLGSFGCIYCPFMPEFQVFHNGTIVTDSGVIPSGMLVARGGRIEQIGPYDPGLIPAAAERIDAGGLYISPGFVDIHVHGGAGSDFMDATPADIETVFRYHSAHGTTS